MQVSSFNTFLLASKNIVLFTIKLDVLSRDAVTLGWNFRSDYFKIHKRLVLFYNSVVGTNLQIESTDLRKINAFTQNKISVVI